MQAPDLKDSFVYDGETYQVDWFDVSPEQPVPDLQWRQVYAIGNLDGKVPLVCYERAEKPYNLPGGTVEPGESVEQALYRELEEEINMRPTAWHPIGYQVVTEPDGKQVMQLRVYAELQKLGEFVNDPGGSVIGNKLIDVHELNTYIDYGAVGERMLEIVRPHFTAPAYGCYY